MDYFLGYRVSSLKFLQVKILDSQNFQDNYEKYKPGNLLDPTLFRDIEIYVLFGTWCHDSQREVPRFLQLLNSLNIQENYIHLMTTNITSLLQSTHL